MNKNAYFRSVLFLSLLFPSFAAASTGSRLCLPSHTLSLSLST